MQPQDLREHRTRPALARAAIESRTEAVSFFRGKVAAVSATVESAFKQCRRKWGGTPDAPSAIPDTKVIARTLNQLVTQLEEDDTLLEAASGGLFVSHTGKHGERVAAIRVDDELHAALPEEVQQRLPLTKVADASRESPKEEEAASVAQG